MKKIYVKYLKSLDGQIAQSKLEKLLLAKQDVELTELPQEADVVLRQVIKGKEDLYATGIKDSFFYLDGNGSIKFLKKADAVILPKNIVGNVEPKNIEFKKNLPLKQQIVDLFNFALGKVDKIQLDAILHEDIMVYLAKAYSLYTSKSVLVEKALNSMSGELGLTPREIQIVGLRVKQILSYEDNDLLKALRSVKGYYIHFKEKGIIIPNMSDNIAIDILDTIICLAFAKNSNKEEVKTSLLAEAKENINKAIKTVRESMLGSSAFQKYSKFDMRATGIYSLFICDNSLKDGEVMIPHPLHVGAPKGYPQKGDRIIGSRHPMTTLIMEATVQSYTMDGSIRCNSKTAEALYGDADGDAQFVCWAKWIKDLDFDNTKDLDNFLVAANIRIEESKYHLTDDMKDELFEIAKTPIDMDKAVVKSSESGLEQATAKLVTKKVTGMFGSAERDVSQTLIINGIRPTMEMTHRKSWLSQIPVQAKNLLSDLRSGKELDPLIKETIMLYCTMQRSAFAALDAISKLFDVDKKQAEIIIDKVYGREVVETLSKDKDDLELSFEKIAGENW